jgi:hypothetical protein
MKLCTRFVVMIVVEVQQHRGKYDPIQIAQNRNGPALTQCEEYGATIASEKVNKQ